jgi:hypothetical protein
MVTATVLFALTWLSARPGYIHGNVITRSWVLALVAEAVLAIGGYVGGTIVFVYGERVVGNREIPVGRALRPDPRSGGDA